MIVLEITSKRKLDSVAFSPDAASVAARSDSGATTVWDVATGSRAAHPGFVLHPTSYPLAFSPTDRPLYTPTVTGLIVTAPGTHQQSQLLSLRDAASTVAVDPTGRRVVWCRRRRPSRGELVATLFTCAERVGDDHRLEWERPATEPPTRVAWIRHLAFCPDGTRFVSAEFLAAPRAGGRLVIRGADTGEGLRYLTGPGADSAHLAISPQGCYLATVRYTALHVFDLNDPAAPSRAVRNDSRKDFTGIAFHPSGRYLAATSNDETVKLYDTATRQVARTFTWDVGRMRSIAFSPDGTLAAAGSDTGKVVVWDVDV